MRDRIGALTVLADILTAGERKALAASLDEWEAEPGEALISQGHQARQGYIVLEGSATVWVGDEPVARLGPGSCIWADTDPWACPRPAAVVADSRMWLLILPPDDLRHLRKGWIRGAPSS